MSLLRTYGYSVARISGAEHEDTLIPAPLAKEVVGFLEKRKSGQLVLHVKDGKILVLDIQESIRL